MISSVLDYFYSTISWHIFHTIFIVVCWLLFGTILNFSTPKIVGVSTKASKLWKKNHKFENADNFERTILIISFLKNIEHSLDWS